MQKRMLAVLFGLIFSIGGFSLYADRYSVRVLADGTPILAEPITETQAIGRLSKGTVIQNATLVGDWFRVKILANEKRPGLTGYIDRERVEIVAVVRGDDDSAERPITGSEPIRSRPVRERPEPVPSRINRRSETIKTHLLSGGFGIGIPYGVIGLNAELNPFSLLGENIMENVTFSVGLGYAVYGIGWSGGVRVYPLGQKKKLQPRVGFYLGSVAAHLNWEEVLSGGAFGGGIVWRPTDRISLDMELVFIAFLFEYSSGMLGSDRVKISTGVKFHL